MNVLRLIFSGTSSAKRSEALCQEIKSRASAIIAKLDAAEKRHNEELRQRLAKVEHYTPPKARNGHG